jgi:cysteinyl-tRNA synthetase
MEERDRARKEKNWAVADDIREKLESMGVAIRDGKI